MSDGIQENPLNSAEEVQDIAEDTAEDIAEEIKAEEGSEAAVLEEAKSVIKPKANAVPVEAAIKAHRSPGPNKLKYKRLP